MDEYFSVQGCLDGDWFDYASPFSNSHDALMFIKREYEKGSNPDEKMRVIKVEVILTFPVE